MVPTKLRMKGITRFREEIVLDLAALPEGLIAVVGGNGVGKTTIMEAMAPAALYRTLPSRSVSRQRHRCSAMQS